MANGWKRIDRIGVRFIEVLRSPKPTYEALRGFVLDTFHKLPLGIPLTHTDSQAVLVHKHGRYAVGPTQKGDEWLKSVFVAPDDNVPDIGLAVDVDSFALGVESTNAQGLVAAIHKVVELTQTVEEALAKAAQVISGQA